MIKHKERNAYKRELNKHHDWLIEVAFLLDTFHVAPKLISKVRVFKSVLPLVPTQDNKSYDQLKDKICSKTNAYC